MAIDYGRKRVGVAITDPLCTIAQPLMTIRRKSDFDLIKRLKCLITENNVGLILVGNPLSMKGEPTEMSQEIERFVRKLKRLIDIEVRLWDERRVSKYAVTKLKDMGLSSKREDVDRVAASIMLEEFLESKRV